MNRYQEMVEEFHRALDIPVGDYMSPKVNRAELRVKLIDEEARETLDGFEKLDLVEYVDGICDLIYVVYGAAIEAGLDLGDDKQRSLDLQAPKKMSPIMLSAGEYGDAHQILKGAAKDASESLLTGKLDQIDCKFMLAIAACHEAARCCGIDVMPFFEEVHRSNMKKAGGPRRADGKVLKPADWTPPDIRGLLVKLGWDPSVQKIQMSTAYGKFATRTAKERE